MKGLVCRSTAYIGYKPEGIQPRIVRCHRRDGHSMKQPHHGIVARTRIVTWVGEGNDICEVREGRPLTYREQRENRYK